MINATADVMLIGLDSLDPSLVRQWANGGLLPNFRRLLDTSWVAPVVSPPNLYAGTVWASFATGVSPAKHRRFFRRQAACGSYLDEDFLPAQIAVEPFWKGLSEAGERIAVIDVPHCALVSSINGIHVVDWSLHEPDLATPALSAEVAHLRDSIWQAPARSSCDDVSRTAEGYRQFVADLQQRIDRKVALTRDVMQRGPWRLLITNIGEAHCVGHQCWHLHDSQHPRYDMQVAAEAGNPMLMIYQKLDAAVGTLIDSAAPGTTVMVLLSHGMGPLYGESVLLDEILRRLEAGVSLSGNVYGVLKKLWYKLPAEWRTSPLLRGARQRFSPALHGSMLVPDRMRRRCFAIPNNPHAGAVRINLEGREAHGLVKSGAEYRALCESLRESFMQIVNPTTGNRMVQEVTIVGDVYDGPFVDELPDLLIEWTRCEPPTALAGPHIGVLAMPQMLGRSGDHRGEGLLLACGPNIGRGERRDEIAITDFAATFAARFGVTMPHLEGRPVRELLGAAPTQS